MKSNLAYYNEFDPKAAAWLRQLIKNGDIADGIVDERSITEVEAKDLAGFAQHHFFAGIGVWSYALRNAGWSDNRPVWTASLPCQPFSVAGKQKGKDDERNLLPHFIELVKQCRPNTIFGEQVEAAIRHGWLDDLYTEMEGESYSVGAVIMGAHSVNKAHQRQRIYWVADSRRKGLERHGRPEQVNDSQGREEPSRHSSESGIDSRMGDTEHDGHATSEKQGSNGAAVQFIEKRESSASEFEGAGSPRAIPSKSIGRLGDTNRDRCESRSEAPSTTGHRDTIDAASGIDWLYCRDNKYRPIKSGVKPLVDGIARGVVYSGGAIDANNTGLARSTRLKGYGNAIVATVAEEFIRAFMEIV